MRSIYADTFTELIGTIEKNRDECVQRNQSYGEAKGAVLSLGDSRFGSYSSMVATNEARAAKAIERIAISLFESNNDWPFELYPVDPHYRLLELSEQAKSRPFQIIVTEEKKKIGVVFCLSEDIGYYSKHFMEGDYLVDSLRLVLLIDPNKEVYETTITLTNEYNKKCGVAIERWTVREFWEEYFGCEEYEQLLACLNDFNEKVNGIIGFSTIVTPTESALNKFRANTGEMIRSYPYKDAIPESVYKPQVDIFFKNYIDRGLWKAMVGESNFAISFIASEWNFQMYQMTENLDLTGVVTGYLKSIEQLIWTIIGFQTQKSFSIKSKQGGLIEYSAENENVIDSTLWSLEQVIKHNSWMFEVNYHARVYLIDAIDDWRKKHRNGYFHKHNLQSIEKAKEIRNQTLQLYFLILGGCTIKDADFVKLGIQ